MLAKAADERGGGRSSRRTSFDGGDFGYGLLVAATGLGLVIGSLVGGELDRPARRWPCRTRSSIALMALGLGAAAVAPERLGRALLVVIAAGSGTASPSSRNAAARPARRAGPAARARVHASS